MKPGNCIAKGFKTTMKKERKATWKKYPKILVQFLMRAFPTYILVLKLKPVLCSNWHNVLVIKEITAKNLGRRSCRL